MKYNISNLTMDELFELMGDAAKIGNRELLDECKAKFEQEYGGIEIPIEIKIRVKDDE